MCLRGNNNYEKNIRFYLDTIFKNKNSLERVRDYEDNPSKNFIEYIKRASEDVNYKFASPMSVFWNLTSACNFRCIHCLYNDTEYANKNDLTTERASLLADELIEALTRDRKTYKTWTLKKKDDSELSL